MGCLHTPFSPTEHNLRLLAETLENENSQTTHKAIIAYSRKHRLDPCTLTEEFQAQLVNAIEQYEHEFSVGANINCVLSDSVNGMASAHLIFSDSNGRIQLRKRLAAQVNVQLNEFWTLKWQQDVTTSSVALTDTETSGLAWPDHVVAHEKSLSLSFNEDRKLSFGSCAPFAQVSKTSRLKEGQLDERQTFFASYSCSTGEQSSATLGYTFEKDKVLHSTRSDMSLSIEQLNGNEHLSLVFGLEVYHAEGSSQRPYTRASYTKTTDKSELKFHLDWDSTKFIASADYLIKDVFQSNADLGFGLSVSGLGDYYCTVRTEFQETLIDREFDFVLGRGRAIGDGINAGWGSQRFNPSSDFWSFDAQASECSNPFIICPKFSATYQDNVFEASYGWSMKF